MRNGIWVIIGVLVVGFALWWGHRAETGVRVPSSSSEVLEHVPSSTPGAKQLRALEAALRENPRDENRATAAARAAIDLARRESDPRYWGRAQAALQPWWNEPRP